MKKLFFIISLFVFLTFVGYGGPQAQTIILSATFHYSNSESCQETLVYIVSAMGQLYSQTPTGLHEGIPPTLEGNIWGNVPWLPATTDTVGPCNFSFCYFITGTGDIFFQTRNGMLDGTVAQWIGNFWGPYTLTKPITWGKIKTIGK